MLALRESRFDGIIAGREVGGITLLTEPPNTEAVRRLASKKEERAEAAPASRAAAPVQAAAPVAAAAPRHRPSAAQSLRKFRLHVLRSLTGGPSATKATRIALSSVPPARSICRANDSVIREKRSSCTSKAAYGSTISRRATEFFSGFELRSSSASGTSFSSGIN